jgi:hypothetical protein
MTGTSDARVSAEAGNSGTRIGGTTIAGMIIAARRVAGPAMAVVTMVHRPVRAVGMPGAMMDAPAESSAVRQACSATPIPTADGPLQADRSIDRRATFPGAQSSAGRMCSCQRREGLTVAAATREVSPGSNIDKHRRGSPQSDAEGRRNDNRPRWREGRADRVTVIVADRVAATGEGHKASQRRRR